MRIVFLGEFTPKRIMRLWFREGERKDNRILFLLLGIPRTYVCAYVPGLVSLFRRRPRRYYLGLPLLLVVCAPLLCYC